MNVVVPTLIPVQEKKVSLSGQKVTIVIVTAVVTVVALKRVKTGGKQMIDMANLLRPNSLTGGETGAEKKEVITGIMFRNFVLNNLMLLIVPTIVVPQQANRFGTIDIGKRMIQITLTPAAIADFECMEMISLYFIVFPHLQYRLFGAIAEFHPISCETRTDVRSLQLWPGLLV